MFINSFPHCHVPSPQMFGERKKVATKCILHRILRTEFLVVLSVLVLRLANYENVVFRKLQLFASCNTAIFFFINQCLPFEPKNVNYINPLDLRKLKCFISLGLGNLK